MKDTIYLDANASYGVLEEVAEELRRHDYCIFNPSSIHSAGQRSRALIEEAREEVGALIGLRAGERLVFTSGATESNNLALTAALPRTSLGFLALNVVLSAVEHPSLLEPARRLTARGVELRLVAPDREGSFSALDFLERCDASTALVSLMLANNETGQVLPVEEVSAIKQAFPRILVHSDATQALGKMEFTFAGLGVDMLSLSGHKIGALPGTGAFVFGSSVGCEPLIVGGSQESRWRAGTENVCGIFSFGVAARVVRRRLKDRMARMRARREQLVALLDEQLRGKRFNHLPGDVLPNTVSLTIDGVHADDLVVALDLEGIHVSSGAACSSGKPEPSHVLLAYGFSEDQASSTIRISLRAEHSADEIGAAAAGIVRCVERMRLVA